MLYNQTFNLDQLLSTPMDVARSYMRARLPWGSPSVNNSEFWSPSSAGTQLLKEGTPFLIILETYPLPRYIRKV
ncbi:unnamed protein product, partial [Brassica rapa subsp. trilocularis]